MPAKRDLGIWQHDHSMEVSGSDRRFLLCCKEHLVAGRLYRCTYMIERLSDGRYITSRDSTPALASEPGAKPVSLWGRDEPGAGNAGELPPPLVRLPSLPANGPARKAAPHHASP